MFIIEYCPDSSGNSSGQLGGGAYLAELNQWPRNGYNVTMTPFLTIRASLFPTSYLPQKSCITVFLPYSIDRYTIKDIRSCTLNDQSQVKEFHGGAGKVVFHEENSAEIKPAEIETFPSFPLISREMTPLEASEDLEDEISGLYGSKLLGRPSWIQDEIFMPEKYFFALQIIEADIVKLDKRYEGIFNDGALYLYLRQSLKKSNHGDVVGEVFIQFT
ncbi:hypothetical protein [Diaphorobacter sp.]|uniref:hypothetical protein n=1 Tax=Diaphorobacter sp. TaxID=1934310 RepID=UPI0028AED48F|nr:hypothetical protein [Diaphorobacter sp.]